MISVEEALERILEFVHVLEPETKPILDVLGQVLAENVRSPITVPPADNTAMDGYAVRAADTKGASPERPVVLRVLEDIGAGHPPTRRVEPGTASRIMTGAPVPAGADAIVPFEETDEARRATGGALVEVPEFVSVYKPAAPTANIREAGEDVRAGQVLMARGRVLRPAEIGVLATIGRTEVAVVRRPVIAILSTGDELVEPGAPLGPGQIYDANSFSVASLVRRYGGVPQRLGIARDSIESLETKVREGLRADMLITSAGVSIGAYDVVKDVLAAEGEITFWTVQMKPGKPLAFGQIGGGLSGGRRIPLLGLPGNPVSSMVAFEQFARPSILKMLGKTNWAKPTVPVVLAEDAGNPGGRRFFMRVQVTRENGRYVATSTGPQGSGILTSMMFGNALAIIPAGVEHVKAGEVLQAQMLDWPEDVEV